MKKSSHSPRRQERGVVLIGVLLLMAILTVLAVAAYTTTYFESQISGNYQTGTEAFYIAEAGLARATKKLQLTPGFADYVSNPNDVFAGSNTLGKGKYIVSMEVLTAAEDAQVGSASTFDELGNLIDPAVSGVVRVVSTGVIDGHKPASATVEATVTLGADESPGGFDYAIFDCGEIKLEGEEDGDVEHVITGDIFSTKKLELKKNSVVNGNVFVGKEKLTIKDNSQINGDVFVDGDVELDSKRRPNIDGNLTASKDVKGDGKGKAEPEELVSGTISSAPEKFLFDKCSAENLGDNVLSNEQVQDMRDNADTFIKGDYKVNKNDVVTLTGIVHVEKNFKLEGSATFIGDVIFVVDGNVEINKPSSFLATTPGSTVTFVIPDGDFVVKDGGNVDIDGWIHMGEFDKKGKTKHGGNLKVEKKATLNINGGIINLKGKVEAKKGADFKITFQEPTDPHITGETPFTVQNWRVRH